MLEPVSVDVAVVGCGVVGLSCAIGLARSGLTVALIGPEMSIFKASEQQVFDSRVFALSGKVKHFLSDLRVWDAMPQSRLQPVQAMEIFSDDTTANALNLRASDLAVPNLTYIVEQQVLLDALMQAAQFTPNLQRFLGVVQNIQMVQDVWALAVERQSNNISNIQSTSNQPVQAKWVVAADGGNSWVRCQTGLDFPIQDYQAYGVVGNFKAERAHNGAARQWFLGDSVLAMLPLPENRVSMVWSMGADAYHRMQHLDPIGWIRFISLQADGRVAQCLGGLENEGAIQAYPLRYGIAKQWFDNQVILVGDAAHLVHPLAGQGLNLGVEDVIDFLRIMQPESRAKDDVYNVFNTRLLRAWQRQRKAACEPVHWLTFGLYHLFRMDLPGARWARNAGLQMVNCVPAIKRWLMAQAIK